MTPDWERLAAEAPVIAALITRLARKSGLSGEVVLDTIAELIEDQPEPAVLRLVPKNPAAA